MQKKSIISGGIPRLQPNEQKPGDGWECFNGSVLNCTGKILNLRWLLELSFYICTYLAKKGDLKLRKLWGSILGIQKDLPNPKLIPQRIY
jgi:hypothetical protein